MSNKACVLKVRAVTALLVFVAACGETPSARMSSVDSGEWPRGSAPSDDAASRGDLGPGEDQVNILPDGGISPDGIEEVGPLCPGGDDDGDGVCNGDDNCTLVVNPDQEDFDGDLVGDACDLDDDNDEDPDETDCAPLDPKSHAGADELCDGVDNDCDGEVDEEPAVECPALGVCADGMTTVCVDGEAVCDYGEVEGGCSYDLCDGLDNDCDGEVDEDDWGICCDCLWEDGYPEWYVVCDPEAANPDDDGDGILDELDNCPQDENPDQEDFDGDLVGDACDPDDDNDGDPDETDCAPTEGSVYTGAPEVCNGVDDNCDGAVDEGFGTLSCGLGECANSVDECVAGVPQVCEPLDVATDEVCDGLDNDCDGETDEELPPIACGIGPCANSVAGCVDGVVPECTPLPVAEPEVCDGVDNDCDGVVDQGLGETTCGSGPCANTVANCVNGQPNVCTPLPAPDGTCNAPPAPCKTTTNGEDACGNPCTKVGPPMCYIVHNACLTSNPGSYTDSPQCYTPKGKYNCGLTCQEWPNTIGADCGHCVNILCHPKSGLDEAQFLCNNYPAPPTP